MPPKAKAKAKAAAAKAKAKAKAVAAAAAAGAGRGRGAGAGGGRGLGERPEPCSPDGLNHHVLVTSGGTASVGSVWHEYALQSFRIRQSAIRATNDTDDVSGIWDGLLRP